MNPITLLITDDNKMLRDSWKMVLDTDPTFHVLATCGTGEEAIEAVKQLHPQLVIMDINLPGISGVEATEIITKAALATWVLGYSLHNESVYAQRILAASAMGYVTKTSSVLEKKKALLCIHHGER